jgi:hypothetical protein
MNGDPAFEALATDEILKRVLRSARMLENLRDAFLLRQNERNSGLSVFYRLTNEACRAGFLTSYGVADLRVGGVRELGLGVVPDELHHANITGLPYQEDDPEMAEWYAGRLADQAAIVDRGKQRGQQNGPEGAERR